MDIFLPKYLKNSKEYTKESFHHLEAYEYLSKYRKIISQLPINPNCTWGSINFIYNH